MNDIQMFARIVDVYSIRMPYESEKGFKMTRLVVFQTPNDLWCFSCDTNGRILAGFPVEWVGCSIEDVSLIASSVLRYRVEKIKDNEYPTKFEITHGEELEVEVKQNGLRMKYAEEYGEWNSDTQTLDIEMVDEKDRSAIEKSDNEEAMEYFNKGR